MKRKAKLLLVRDEFRGDYTTGKLYLNGRFFCYTIEDVVRKGDIAVAKIPGLTAIPAGKYKVEITYSPRFGVRMPLVLNVRNFSGIRMHNGTSADSSEGCIILGYTRLSGGRLKSDQAWRDLRDKLESFDETELEIVNGKVIRLALGGLLLLGLALYYLHRRGYLAAAGRYAKSLVSAKSLVT